MTTRRARQRRAVPIFLDAATSIVLVAASVLLAAQVKPVPPSLHSWLGQFFTWVWIALLFIGSASATIGALLRFWTLGIFGPRHDDPTVSRIPSTQYFFEVIGWPTIAWCALLFGLGTASRAGLLGALLTMGFTAFVIFTCIGHWWRLWDARLTAEANNPKEKR